MTWDLWTLWLLFFSLTCSWLMSPILLNFARTSLNVSYPVSWLWLKRGAFTCFGWHCVIPCDRWRHVAHIHRYTRFNLSVYDWLVGIGAFCCPPCFACFVANRMNENTCGPIMGKSFTVAMRTRLRGVNGIEVLACLLALQQAPIEF